MPSRSRQTAVASLPNASSSSSSSSSSLTVSASSSSSSSSSSTSSVSSTFSSSRILCFYGSVLISCGLIAFVQSGLERKAVSSLMAGCGTGVVALICAYALQVPSSLASSSSSSSSSPSTSSAHLRSKSWQIHLEHSLPVFIFLLALIFSWRAYLIVHVLEKRYLFMNLVVMIVSSLTVFLLMLSNLAATNEAKALVEFAEEERFLHDANNIRNNGNAVNHAEQLDRNEADAIQSFRVRSSSKRVQSGSNSSKE